MGLSERVLRNADARMAEELPISIEHELVQYEALLRNPKQWHGPYTRPEDPAHPHELSLEEEAEIMDDMLSWLPENVRKEYRETLSLVWEDQTPVFPDDQKFGQEVVADKRDWERVFGLADDKHSADLLVLHTAVKMCAGLRATPRRFQMLREIMRLEHSRSELARVYVRTAAELFLWGLDAPCIVYAAAAIEASLKEFAREQQIVDLDERDSTARHITKLLSAPVQKKAHALRALRNDILHNAEKVLFASDELLRGDISPHGLTAADSLRILTEVLDELWPWTGGANSATS